MADWVTVEVNLDPLLEPVDPILVTIDSVLGFLITLLNIVQAILNVLKVFLVGLLDPLRTLVELVIEEVRALIRDLRQLGVYLTGDWDLLAAEGGFSNVLGGYQAYERRMINRLQDTSDPNRPDFSSSSAALGAFFYTSSGDINELIRVVNAFLRFLGQENLAGRSAPYGRPTTPEMKFGQTGDAEGQFRPLGILAQGAGEVPDQVTVTWQMPARAGGIGQLFSPAPKGFLIHASTIPDGFNVLGLTPKDDKTGKVKDLPRVQAAAIDPTTNGPLKLYGGIADIGAAGDSKNFDPVENNDPRAPILVLQKDQNTPLIKPSLLKEKGTSTTPLIANTYYVKTSFLQRTGAGATYTATFPRSALPLGASFQAGSDGFAEVDGSTFEPDRYWFRIRALTEDFVTALDGETATASGTPRDPASVYASNVRLFRFSPQRLRESRNGVLVPEPPGVNSETNLTANAFTAASSPGIAEFPTSDQITYLRAVQSAIALAVLCRADLTEASSTSFAENVYAPGQGLRGLEGAGRDLMAQYEITETFFKGTRPQVFRQKMRWLMGRVATDLQNRAAPPATVASLIVSEAEPLLTFKWSDMETYFPDRTILESFDANLTAIIQSGVNAVEVTTELRGIGANPYCRSLSKKELQTIYTQPRNPDHLPDRSPAFLSKAARTKWIPGEGSADFSPIVYNDSTRDVEYIRNAFLARTGTETSPSDFDAVLDSAVAVLQLAAAPLSRPLTDSNWIAIRLLPQALIPLDDLLERLDRFLAGILDGLEGIIDKIVAYIEAIQARIYQLQALLEQIRALLRSLDFFALPSVSGLVIVESGTDGLTAGLVTSTNKPFDSASSYGAGVAIVAGGLPSFLLEILTLILGGGSEG
jgi:hypothetical protein